LDERSPLDCRALDPDLGCCWVGLLVPQQHRLVSLAPSIAPVLLGLNTAGSFFGISAAGIIGASGIQLVGAHNLGFVGAGLAVAAFFVAELATMHITAIEKAAPAPARA
jgi:predicted MFS family arabinose efflux permease